MKTRRGIGFLLLAGMMFAPAVAGKVYVRWTESAMPPEKILGVSDLVIPWRDGAKGLAEAAKKQGYHVYWEATLDQAAAAASANLGTAGIVLQGSATDEKKLEESAKSLRTQYPKLKILVLSAQGKQPEMRGWLVFKKNGILQVSSPTSQPWLDQNLAMVRYERAFEQQQAPLYTFSWDETDPLVKENGPSPGDYSLAIAEAGALHSDLILEVHERQQKGLLSGEKETLSNWGQVKRTIAFYDRQNEEEKEAAAVAVLTDDYDTSYEEINLMARHNISFRVLNSADVKAQELGEFEVVIAFSALPKGLPDGIRAFAERGGVAILVNLPGTYPWDSTEGKKNGTSVTYTVGKGRVIELGEAVSDPETFAQDVRRLMDTQRIPVSLWNSLTTMVAEYRGDKPGEATVELVNYDEETTQVQVQVKGSFKSVRFESPEQGCCETLKPEHVDGFTDFVVPNLVSGGRVHLQ